MRVEGGPGNREGVDSRSFHERAFDLRGAGANAHLRGALGDGGPLTGDADAQVRVAVRRVRGANAHLRVVFGDGGPPTGDADAQVRVGVRRVRGGRGG